MPNLGPPCVATALCPRKDRRRGRRSAGPTAQLCTFDFSCATMDERRRNERRYLLFGRRPLILPQTRSVSASRALNHRNGDVCQTTTSGVSLHSQLRLPRSPPWNIRLLMKCTHPPATCNLYLIRRHEGGFCCRTRCWHVPSSQCRRIKSQLATNLAGTCCPRVRRYSSIPRYDKRVMSENEWMMTSHLLA